MPTRPRPAITTLNTARAGVSAAQNRLQFAADNLATSLQNNEAARSNLLDLDVAAEISKFTSLQVLSQIGVSTLAQANQLTQSRSPSCPNKNLGHGKEETPLRALLAS